MEEHSRYVAQLKAEFDSCDTTETGFLDRDELTELCSRLQLDAHLDLLLHTLLGRHSRVNFEEFKDGFVSVLSRSLDFSTSEDDSSYLEPVFPEEVKPKFVKGTKRYGRRSRPDSTPGAALTCDSEDSPPSRTEASDSSPVTVRRAKLRRATSLESVESLKSDDEAGSQKDSIPTHFQSQAHQQEEEELGVGGEPHVLTAMCQHLGLQHLHTEEVDVLLRKLDADLDGRVSIREFKKVLCGSVSMTCSTPIRSADLQRAPHGSQMVLEEPGLSARSTSSLLSATVGQKVLSRLDNGSGSTSPDQVIALWTEEGIRNSRDILQTLDFPLEERLSLTDLTLALDNELLVSGNGIHQVALISYKNEIQHLQEAADQACRERDKVKADLELADQRNLQLVREVDDRHASMETLNQTRIRDLEQDFRDRLTALRSQSEQESEALLQQVERERSTMQEELQLLRAQEAELREELNGGKQENLRLEEELNSVKLQLNEAQSSVNKLQRDLDQLLHDKFGSLDPAGAGPTHEEGFSEIVREYELQCRELQDRNDELSSEVELLKSQRRNQRSAGDDDNTTLSWRQQHSDSDDSDMKRSSSPSTRKKLQPADKTALCSLDDVSGPAVSIQTELALEQLKQKHNQELQQLNIQLETQVNYYKRSLDLMRQSMEVERKDISQAFKLEISELEEQKSEAEQQVKQLKDSLDKLQIQIQHGGGGGGGWSSEQQRRMQRERAELEQNFAREIGNLVQKLSAEKEQLEAELKLKMDQELLLVRDESQQQLAQMKLHHAELQRRLLHQLHRQRGFWENRVVQSEEQHQEEVRRLEEQLSRPEEAGRSELEACRGRSSELEARLEEACTQLQSHEVLNRHLAAAKSSVEEQLQLTELRVESETCRSLREQELENLQGALRIRTESVSRLSAELDSLRTDRARLIQDLKDQAMAVDNLQLQLDGRRSSEEGLQEALRQEWTRTSQLRSGLDEEKEEVCRLRQENRSYIRLADQLSTQIVDMEEEISTLREHLRELSQQLNDTADLVLDLRTQLNSRTSKAAEQQNKTGESRSEVQQLSAQLEAREAELDRVKKEVLQLQQALQESRKQLEVLQDSRKQPEVLQDSRKQQDFEEEKWRLTQQLMELEQLVLALEEASDPSGSLRTQLEEVRSENGAQQERDKLQQQNTWMQEKQLLQKEVSCCKEKLDLQVDVEAELSSATLKLQWLEEDKDKLLRDAEDRNNKVEKLQHRLVSLESEAELLRSQLLAVSQDGQGHAHEAGELHGKLQEAQSKVEELEGGVRRLLWEKEELNQDLEQLRVQNQDLQNQVSELQVQDLQVQKLNQEQQNLRSRLSEAEEQAVRADASLSLLQAQHLRQLQQLQERTDGGRMERLEELQEKLEEEQRRSQQLEETLKMQLQQSTSQISMKQDQHEKVTAALQQTVQALEVKLKGVRLVLQDKVQQLKDQMVKSSKVSVLLKDVYVENSQLMKALQVTEQRQKQAEKKNWLLEEKVRALNKLLREIVSASLAT
uniref:EF-hand domain-containing protein n=1 Tax=Amphiprion ocellaris TaxID=80972 RepID=A0AAQ5YAG6_AMPOC